MDLAIKKEEDLINKHVCYPARIEIHNKICYAVTNRISAQLELRIWQTVHNQIRDGIWWKFITD